MLGAAVDVEALGRQQIFNAENPHTIYPTISHMIYDVLVGTVDSGSAGKGCTQRYLRLF